VPDLPVGWAGIILGSWDASGARGCGGPGEDVGKVESSGKNQKGGSHAADRQSRRGPLHVGSSGGPNGCGTVAIAATGTGALVLGMRRHFRIGILVVDVAEVRSVPVDVKPRLGLPRVRGCVLRQKCRADRTMRLGNTVRFMVRAGVEATCVHPPPAEEDQQGQHAHGAPFPASPGDTPQFEAKGRVRGPGRLHDS
jgi:hypothetical protein